MKRERLAGKGILRGALIEPRGIETKFFDNNNVYVSSALIEPRGIETGSEAIAVDDTIGL